MKNKNGLLVFNIFILIYFNRHLFYCLCLRYESVMAEVGLLLILLFTVATLSLNEFMAAVFTQMDSIWGKHWTKIGKSRKMSLIHVYGFIQAIPGMRLK